MTYKFKLLFALLIVATASHGQTGFTFLEIPVGARESALGGAGVALVTGPTSAAHNPAALARLQHTSFAALTTRHFGDTRASYFGLNIRTRRLAIAPHFWGTAIPDIEYRTAPTSEPISKFDATYSAVGVATGYAVNDNLSAGVTLRYLHSKINYESAEGWSTDAGVLWQSPIRELLVGASVNHLGSVNQYMTDEVTLPTTARLGGAWSRDLGTKGGILVTAAGDAVKDQTPRFSGGVEYRAPDYLAVRAGYVTGLEAQGVSFGAGVRFKRFQVDYALVPYKEALGEGHRVGLTVEF